MPHHLVDVADPRVDFSVADYVTRAEHAIAEIGRRGRVPLVVGGTGMYLRGLLRGLVPAPARDVALRRRLRAMAERFGAPRLHRLLARLDRTTAERLSPGDTQRIVRALEVALAGGATWSQTLRERGTWRDGGDRFVALKFGLDGDREAIGRRLDARVERFFAAGLADEVRSLLAQGVPPGANALKAIGYREVVAALRSGADPEQTLAEVQRSTRRLAKRQRTWFRREPGVLWLDALYDADRIADRIATRWESRRDD